MTQGKTPKKNLKSLPSEVFFQINVKAYPTRNQADLPFSDAPLRARAECLINAYRTSTVMPKLVGSPALMSSRPMKPGV
jgi:hypothetical protein